MNKIKVLGATASIILAATGVMAKSSPIAKYLAGPSEEIELMQKASPESAAIISKHAMISVDLNQNSMGQYSWQKNILIDGDNPKVLLFSPNKDQWQINISNDFADKNRAGSQIKYFTRETKFGLGAEQFPATQFELQNLKNGRYQLKVDAQNVDKGYLLVSSDSPYRLKSYVSTTGQLVGDVINVNASAFTNDEEFTVVKNDLQLINSSYMRITAPDGTVNEISMFDDGFAFDKAALDGEFNGQFKADQAGLYQVQVVSQGITPKGMPFYRTAEHVIPVIKSDLMLNSKQAHGTYSSPNKIDINMAVATEMVDTRYRVLAEVWGTQQQGKAAEPVAISWLSTIASVEDGVIKLQLDDRWIMSKQAYGPFELKNIRIEDIEHYISVLDVNSLPLMLPEISDAAKTAYDGGLNESMLKGEKPESLQQADKAGGKLMLVHGYCSSDVWGQVQSQFSNYVKFTDFNQNRSHDAFARQIDSYGDNFPSFGIVAHSQGGAAALHLYTYYWSGLDDADPGRLIQSVGTPYQGTPLAGNLAAIGDIFGVGCGYNSNLTVSGGGAWLSGIPTWARSKVNYYTTSFTTKWWRPDWCNFASDIILSDPEDGTTEKSRGQVSGAVNRGHKTGQCHTDGMRDMAQTRDSGRNSTMNSNAAR